MPLVKLNGPSSSVVDINVEHFPWSEGKMVDSLDIMPYLGYRLEELLVEVIIAFGARLSYCSIGSSSKAKRMPLMP